MDTDVEELAEESYGIEEIDEMLDELMEEEEENEDFAERLRRRGRRRGRGVPVARRPSVSRPPMIASGFVTHQQLQETIRPITAEQRRGAQGLRILNGRVNGVVRVNRVQSRAIARVDKAMKLDGIFEFIEAVNLPTATAASTPTAASISLYQVLKGAVKSGYLGQGKGVFANPLLIGGLGFVLRNPGILGGLFP